MFGCITQILAIVALVATLSHAQTTTPLESRDARASDLMTSLSSNEFVGGPTGTDTVQRIITLQDRIIENGGCNLNLCFGLDGSNLITNADYERQREFVQLVAATVAIDERVKMSAYQYGLRLQRISGFTQDINQFLLNLELPERSETLDRSFLTPALFQCQRDFRGNKEDANKLVIIGDGRTNYGSREQAVRIAEKFLPPNNNGAICAVYVHKPSKRFLERITQDPNKIVEVEEYFKFSDILEDVVSNVCDLV